MFTSGLSGFNVFNNHELQDMLKKRRKKLIAAKETIEEGISIKEKYTHVDDIQLLVVNNMLDTIEGQIKLIDDIVKL